MCVAKYQAQWSVEVSEAAATLFGLKVATRFGFEYVQLEGDFLNVVVASLSEMVTR